MAAISGCASNIKATDLTSEQRKHAANMVFVAPDDLAGIDYEIMGEATGVSCTKNLYSTAGPYVQEAIRAMGLHAAKLGGNGVTNIVCSQSEGTDWVNNCWESITCVGDAILFKDDAAPEPSKAVPYTLI